MCRLYKLLLSSQIDNRRLGLVMDKPAVNAWHLGAVQAASSSASASASAAAAAAVVTAAGVRHWVRTEHVHVEQAPATLEAVSALVQRSAARDLQDFDNYLDDVQNDWRNGQLNRDLPQLLAMY